MPSDPAKAMTPSLPVHLAKKTLFFVAALASVAGYIGLTLAFHLHPAYAGFIFALLWGGFHHAEVKAIPQLLCASLFGIALAYLFQVAPNFSPHYGPVCAEVVVLICVYCLLAGWVKFIIDNTTMMFLIIGTIPAIQAKEDFKQMALATIVSALYFGALGYLMSRGNEFVRKRYSAKISISKI